MKQYLVLKTQANQIFKILRARHFPVEQFVWETAPSAQESDTTVSRLVHAPSGFYFQFDRSAGAGHRCQFSPGETERYGWALAADWADQIENFRVWLGYLKREIETIDLWAAIANEKVLAAVSDEPNQNTTFSADELIRIESALHEIQKYLLSSQQFPAEQREYLDRKFANLNDAATRLGRKDWIIILLGTLTQVIISLALAPSIARELLRIAGTLFRWLTGLPLLP